MNLTPTRSETATSPSGVKVTVPAPRRVKSNDQEMFTFYRGAPSLAPVKAQVFRIMSMAEDQRRLSATTSRWVLSSALLNRSNNGGTGRIP